MLKIIPLHFLLLATVSYVSQPLLAAQTTNQADLIVFSYNRPLQLEALLKSVATYVTGIKNIFIEYLASDSAYEEAYEVVKKQFHTAHFIQQDRDTAHSNFKRHLCDIVEHQSTQEYVIFATDDIVVCDTVDLSDCIKHIEQTDALGFYLRLGKNITHHYIAGNKKVPRPHFQAIKNNTLKWRFSESKNPWRYHHTVDMTVYKKSYVLPAIKALPYKAPNSFEGLWSKLAPGKASGLCYEHSKIVNLPLNLVQVECNNKHMNAVSAEALLKLFQAGFRMDIDKLAHRHNKSVHDDFLPEFVPKQVTR